MDRFGIAILFLVIGLVVGWCLHYIADFWVQNELTGHDYQERD